jgi:hypothetical protein
MNNERVKMVARPHEIRTPIGLNMNGLKFTQNSKKNKTRAGRGFQKLVGKTGFEPATPWSQTRCATGLRYFPDGATRSTPIRAQR